MKQNTAAGKIIKILADSLAEELGLAVADEIHEINAHKLRDIFDFQFYFSQSDEIEMLVKHADGEWEIYEFDKDFDELLGVEFENPLFNGIRECSNKCEFCFIDQQPHEQTRKSLHLKDDDFRLSYLCGSYITLTNLNTDDRKRIEELRPGPLHISIHATEIELRNKMLGRKSSIPILDELKWLDSLNIPCHGQIVVCPEMNDGQHLLRTINDLYLLRDKPLISLAIVPVGLTKYNTTDLRSLTIEEAKAVMELVKFWEDETEARKSFVHLSDEFYLMTGQSLPHYSDYGEHAQLEDGVATTSLFMQEIISESERLPASLPQAKTVSWINGTIAKNELQEIANLLNSKVHNLNLQVICLDSNFWGATNVAGLLTGQDLIDGFREYGTDKLGDYVIIPSIMLKDATDTFLDDLELSDVEKFVGRPCVKAWGAKEFINALY